MVLRAVFWKEWTEAKRDPRAWLLSLVVPVLFYPGAVWLGAGGAGQGPLRVATADAWLGERLARIEGIETAPPGGEADAVVAIARKSPGFPATGTMTVDTRILHGGWVARQRIELALQAIGRRLTAERAEQAGLAPGDLRPIRQVGDTANIPGVTSGTANLQKPPGTAGATPLVAYLLVFVLFTGCLATAVDAGAGERERGGMEALLVTPAAPGEIAGGKILFIMLTGLASVAASLLGLLLAVWAGGGNAAMLTKVGAGPALTVAFLLLPCAAMVASWLFACSLAARSAREAHAWISGAFLLVSLGLVWLTFGGGANLPWISWTPLFGAASAIGTALDGHCSPTHWAIPWLSSSLGALLGIQLCAHLLRRETTLRAW